MSRIWGQGSQTTIQLYEKAKELQEKKYEKSVTTESNIKILFTIVPLTLSAPMI
jgi:hypothetical protein